MKVELIKILSEFTKDDIIRIEKSDPQFVALKKLYQKIEDKNLFIKFVLINALISYQLQTTGEKYWQNFSEFFSIKKRKPDDFYQFIQIYNKRLINQRQKRLKKVLECVAKTDDNFLAKSMNNPMLLLDFLSTCLKQKKDAKTIVFSIKMFLYSLDIVYEKHHFAPFGIMLPIDSRIKKISSDKSFWFDIEKKTAIPLLHLDSIIWNALNHENNQPKLIKLRNFLHLQLYN